MIFTTIFQCKFNKKKFLIRVNTVKFDLKKTVDPLCFTKCLKSFWRKIIKHVFYHFI